MLKLVIIDDEKKARESILSILDMYKLDLAVVGQADSVSSGVELISKELPDIVLLDISMPDGNGFDILNKLSSFKFKLIFITAYQEYAIKAIKLSALDYILKPINPEELIHAIEKAKEMIEVENMNLNIKTFISNFKASSKEEKRIVLKTAENLLIVNISDITKCESDGNYTVIYFTNRDSVIVTKTLKDFEDVLQGFGFFRAHKSHLINLNHIISYERKDGGYILMKDSSIVPVSNRKRDELLAVFKEM